jgi:4'-phosphopantetheinyl transferase EntD
VVSEVAARATQLLSQRFGDAIRVVVSDIEARDDDLLEAERPHVARAVPKRRYDFAAGRRLARTLLGPDVALPSMPSRAPAWPPGVRGTIAHAGGLCVVAVTEAATSLGVDVEPWTPLAPGTARLVLSEAERASLGPNADLDAKRAFCAKEAFFKAQWPLAQLRLDFLDAHVALFDDGFEIEPIVATPPAIEGRHRGFFVTVDDYVFAGLVISAS